MFWPATHPIDVSEARTCPTNANVQTKPEQQHHAQTGRMTNLKCASECVGPRYCLVLAKHQVKAGWCLRRGLSAPLLPFSDHSSVLGGIFLFPTASETMRSTAAAEPSTPSWNMILYANGDCTWDNCTPKHVASSLFLPSSSPKQKSYCGRTLQGWVTWVCTFPLL